MDIRIRQYSQADLPTMLDIWNQVISEGDSFPWVERMDTDSAKELFAAQTYTAVAEDSAGRILGMYILHPNNIGRCSHLANASYAVDAAHRGRHIGKQLVLDSLLQAKAHGFKVLQFNAVVASNAPALHLYKKLGFTCLGCVPGGFRMPDGSYEDIYPHYKVL